MADLATFKATSTPSPQTSHTLRSAPLTPGSGPGSAVNVATLTLTAGTYDINAMVGAIFTGAPSYMEWGISNGNSATIIGFNQSDVPGGNGPAGETRHGQSLSSTATEGTFTTPTFRFTIVGTTTFYLVAYFTFVGGTTSVFGSMTACLAH